MAIRLKKFIFFIVSLTCLVGRAEVSGLTTSWDGGMGEKGAFPDQPSWFPEISCRRAWKNKADLYQFNFERHALSQYLDRKKYNDLKERHPEEANRYLESQGEKFGCQGDAASLHECLWTRPHAAYREALKAGLGVARKDCYKDVTLIFVQDGDNDLADYALWDIYEAEAAFNKRSRTGKIVPVAGSTIKKDVIFQHDGARLGGIRRLQIFQTKQKYEVKKRAFFTKQTIEDRQSPVIEILPEPNEDSAAQKQKRFVDAVEWGMKEFPALRYVVVLWGHGKGWMVRDDRGVAHLSGLELKNALKDIYEGVLESKRPIDNFVADACFMGGLELTTELSRYARFVSSSSQVQSFLGLPVRTILRDINSSFQRLEATLRKEIREEKALRLPVGGKQAVLEEGDIKKDMAKAIAFEMPGLVAAAFDPRGYQGRVDAESVAFSEGKDFFTFATVDSTKLRTLLVPELEALAQALSAFLNEVPEEKYERQTFLRRRIPEVKMFKSAIRTRELGSTLGFLKLLAFEKRFSGNETAKAVVRAAHSAQKALGEAIPAKRFSPLYVVEGKSYTREFHAMGFWLPRDPFAYEQELEKGEFRQTLLFQDGSAWAKMLENLYIEPED